MPAKIDKRSCPADEEAATAMTGFFVSFSGAISWLPPGREGCTSRTGQDMVSRDQHERLRGCCHCFHLVSITRNKDEDREVGSEIDRWVMIPGQKEL